MARVSFTPHLRRYFDLPQEWVVEAGTVAELLHALDKQWPGIGFYIADERGGLRKHVAIWINGDQIEDREDLTDPLAEDASVTILQALSGG
jgi:molybdopterin synthase sulfur carrier subunit